jgi:hypothetical protein
LDCFGSRNPVPAPDKKSGGSGDPPLFYFRMHVQVNHSDMSRKKIAFISVLILAFLLKSDKAR